MQKSITENRLEKIPVSAQIPTQTHPRTRGKIAGKTLSEQKNSEIRGRAAQSFRRAYRVQQTLGRLVRGRGPHQTPFERTLQSKAEAQAICAEIIGANPRRKVRRNSIQKKPVHRKSIVLSVKAGNHWVPLKIPPHVEGKKPWRKRGACRNTGARDQDFHGALMPACVRVFLGDSPREYFAYDRGGIFASSRRGGIICRRT